MRPHPSEEIRLSALRESKKNYRLRNPEKVRESRERWRKKNLESYRRYYREWHRNNQELRRKLTSEWGRKNSAKRNAYKTQRMAMRIKATPKWANLEKIEEFYEQAKEVSIQTGIAHSVDHIVPLTSGLVCGLHVESNLRVIPHLENISKKNYYWPDMPI